jgi:hypothetical protein
LNGLLTQWTLNRLLIAIFHAILVTYNLSHCTPYVRENSKLVGFVLRPVPVSRSLLPVTSHSCTIACPKD